MLIYWILQNSLTEPNVDGRMLCYSHGGVLHLPPGHFLVYHICLAEALLQRISISALDYTLAPEAPFPSQLVQAARGYQYLCGEIGFNPRLRQTARGIHLSSHTTSHNC